MKKLATLLVMILLLGLAGTANSALWDRGGGLIYDDFLDITWLQDTNLAQTSGYDANGGMYWDDAVVWANQLVYGGYADWRLPDVYNHDGSGPYTGFQENNELGHMYYINLGGIASSSVPPEAKFIDGNGDNVSFENLQLLYWTRTAEHGDATEAWRFTFGGGSLGPQFKASDAFAWAVRDGDSTPPIVPIPGIIWLLGSGLIVFAGYRKKIGRGDA